MGKDEEAQYHVVMRYALEPSGKYSEVKEPTDMAEDAARIVQEPLVTGEPPRKILEPTTGMLPIPQYSLSKILLVWAAAAIPMGILGWLPSRYFAVRGLESLLILGKVYSLLS